jgi:predicted RNA binding protein with dsRBD fold (UPF0201 family)
MKIKRIDKIPKDKDFEDEHDIFIVSDQANELLSDMRECLIRLSIIDTKMKILKEIIDEE